MLTFFAALMMDLFHLNLASGLSSMLVLMSIQRQSCTGHLVAIYLLVLERGGFLEGLFSEALNGWLVHSASQMDVHLFQVASTPTGF